MFRTDKILVQFQSYIGSGGGSHWRGIGVIADRLRKGIPWWMGLVILATLFVVPNLLAATLSKIWLQFPGMDKPTHFAAFAIVFLTAYSVMRGRAWPGSERGKLGAAVGISLVISLVDEIQQAMLGLGRTAEYGDLVADAAGISVGLTVMMAGRLGVRRTIAIVALLLVPVGLVTAKTYQDLKHFNRGMVYEREHDYERARSEYMLALESGFQSAELYNTIAWIDVEFLDKDPVEAERYAAQAFEMDRHNPDILDTYGWILVKVGRSQEGLPLLERAKGLKPDMYCIDLHLGVAYREVGDRSRAAEYLKRQVERNPADRWGISAAAALNQLEGIRE